MKKQRKKRKLFSITILTCITVVFLVAVLFFAIKYSENKMKPDDLLKQYVAYIGEHNYEGMYAMLDEQSLDTTKEYFITRNQKIYEGIEAENIEISIQRLDDSNKSQVTVFYTMSMNTVAGALNFDNRATFKKVKKRGYCLEWNQSVIFPNLKVADKVRVSKLEARRGDILDRNGVLLVGQGLESSVGLVTGKMSGNRQECIAKLSKLLDVPVETIEKKLEATWVKGDSLVPIKTIEKINPLDLESINMDEERLNSEELQNELFGTSVSNILKNNRLKNEELQSELLEIPGVMISDIKVRTYPLKESASHLTGYVQNITAEELEEHKGEGYSVNSVIGKSGLEKLYEDELRGKEGCEIKIVTSDGQEKETLIYTHKEDGENIKLTIDANLQEAIYEQFSEDKSCCVAMNPKTGEVLALVSTPSFNSNDFVAGMSHSKWTALNEDEKKPLWNRFRATWCPGSTFKSVVAALGVSTGTINPDEDFENVGRSWQKDASWGKYHVTTLHDYDGVRLENALIYSDNIYFAKAALKMGEETLTDGLDKIGFGESIPFDIGMAASQYSNSDTIDGEIQLADSGYGQGQVLGNPLQLASIYTAFVNDGSMIMPYIKYNTEKQPNYYKENVFTKEATSIVKNALIQAIESPHGSAYACQLEGVSLAGKTGTAEIKASKEDTSGTELGWFAVFTTDTDSDNALLMVNMVEDVKDRGGSSYVVKKDRTILKDIYYGRK